MKNTSCTVCDVLKSASRLLALTNPLSSSAAGAGASTGRTLAAMPSVMATIGSTGQGNAAVGAGTAQSSQVEAVVSSLADSFTGTYRRLPVENGWHVGIIAVNTAPISTHDGAAIAVDESVMSANDAGEARDDGTNAEGGQIDTGNVDERHSTPATATGNTSSSTESRVATDGGGGVAVLRWMNRAGAEWDLHPTADPDVLATGHENPYHDRFPEFVLRRDDKGEVIG